MLDINKVFVMVILGKRAIKSVWKLQRDEMIQI